MPHDSKGNLIQDGDLVTMTFKVSEVSPQETFCNGHFTAVPPEGVDAPKEVGGLPSFTTCLKLATKVLAMLLLCASLALAGGCSDLQASKATALAIDQDAVRMAAPSEPNAMLAFDYDAGRFAFYAGTATVNPFAHVFDKNRTILCTATIYQDLQEKSDRSAEHARRVHAAATQPALVRPEEPALWRIRHASWMEVIKREKDGN